MKKYIAVFVVLCCVLLCCSACAPKETTHIRFTIKADATELDGQSLPTIYREITFPVSALEKKTVLFAILYACDALGYSYEREGKYHEILASVAGRDNLPEAAWVIEAADQSGSFSLVSTDDAIDHIAYLSITYKANA